MILVDTSVLINYLKDQKNEAVKQFEYILEKSLPYGINTFIYQEHIQIVRQIYCFDFLNKQ